MHFFNRRRRNQKRDSKTMPPHSFLSKLPLSLKSFSSSSFHFKQPVEISSTFHRFQFHSDIPELLFSHCFYLSLNGKDASPRALERRARAFRSQELHQRKTLSSQTISPQNPTPHQTIKSHLSKPLISQKSLQKNLFFLFQ